MYSAYCICNGDFKSHGVTLTVGNVCWLNHNDQAFGERIHRTGIDYQDYDQRNYQPAGAHARCNTQ
jgi:hypothetical protein